MTCGPRATAGPARYHPAVHRTLAIATLILWSGSAQANAPWVMLLVGPLWLWWTVPLALVVEALALRLLFAARWWAAAAASVVLNLASALLGIVLFQLWVGDGLESDGLRFMLYDEQGGVRANAVLFMVALVAIGCALELGLAWRLFRVRWSARRGAVLLILNLLTSGSVFLHLVPADYWDPLTAGEVARLEASYGPEVAFMKTLLETAPAERREPGWLAQQREGAAALRFLDLWMRDGQASYALKRRPPLGYVGHREADYSAPGVHAVRHRLSLSGKEVVSYSYRLERPTVDGQLVVEATFGGLVLASP